MIIVGALVRAKAQDNASVQAALAKLPGAMVQGFEDPTKIGLVFESDGLNEAYDVLKNRIGQIEGVLAVFPVHANFESLAAEA
jgi:nitrate reductase NapAB chaperone NapD